MIKISEENKTKLAEKLQELMESRWQQGQYLYHTEVWIDDDGEVVSTPYLSQNSWTEYNEPCSNRVARKDRHRITDIMECYEGDIDECDADLFFEIDKSKYDEKYLGYSDLTPEDQAKYDENMRIFKEDEASRYEYLDFIDDYVEARNKQLENWDDDQVECPSILDYFCGW